MTEADTTIRVRARWLRQRLEGKVPSQILAALNDEELVEQYEQEQRLKLDRLKARHAPQQKE
jgi:hypothetical protein